VWLLAKDQVCHIQALPEDTSVLHTISNSSSSVQKVGCAEGLLALLHQAFLTVPKLPQLLLLQQLQVVTLSRQEDDHAAGISSIRDTLCASQAIHSHHKQCCTRQCPSEPP
jgi:hypothetical protein